MKRKLLAEFISITLSPFIILMLIPLIVVYRQTGNLNYSLKWEAFSLIFIFIGLVLFLIGRAKGVYSDIDISKREEREGFYLTTLVCAFVYFIATAILKGFSFHLTAVILSTFLTIFAFMVVNSFIKASIHLGATCAFVLILGLFYGSSFLIPLFFLIPLMAWSRLELNKHTPKELLVGGLLGTTITLLSFFIWRFLI